MSLLVSDTEKGRVFEEFSPKKMILQAYGFFLYIISQWKIILLVAILCAAGGYLYTFLKKPNYLAEITFALDEGISPGSKSSYSSLGAELGIDVDAEAGGVFSSMSNIVELIKSRLLIEKTLKSSVRVDGKNLVFADFFLDSLNYRDKWIKDDRFKKLDFKSYKMDTKAGLMTNSLITNMYETLISNNLYINKKGDGTSIISVTCITENELFSKYFLEALLNEVTQYYIETKTQRSKINLAFLQKRTDSLKRAYYNSMYGKASYADAHSNPSRQIATVYRDKQQTDIQIQRTSYAELMRSLDVAKSNLLRDTPLFQFLDTPVLPLKRFNSNPTKNSIIFFAVGAFLTIAFFGVKKIIKFLMR